MTKEIRTIGDFVNAKRQAERRKKGMWWRFSHPNENGFWFQWFLIFCPLMLRLGVFTLPQAMGITALLGMGLVIYWDAL